MSAEEVLRWAAEEFGDGLCLTCSWQRQSSVLIHMLSELELDVDIVELDTMVLFPETYETRDRLVERYGLELTSFRPIDPPDRLWETKPDECCTSGRSSRSSVRSPATTPGSPASAGS